MRYGIILSLILLLLSGCKRPEEDNKNIVARVGDQVLTKDDLNALLIENKVQAADSAKLIKQYVRNWVVSEVLSQRAEQNLNDVDLKKIEKMVDEYRTTLFVEQYKQRYINQKLDTNISESDLIRFYNSLNFEYHLKYTVVKALEVMMPLKNNKFYKVRKLLQGDMDKNIRDLDKLCNDNQFKMNDFGGKWIPFGPLGEKFHINENMIKAKKVFSAKDSLAGKTFLLRILDVKYPGDTIPFALVKDDLKKIIYHKRKENIIFGLEHNAYQDVVENKDYYIAKPYIIKDEN